MLGRNIHHLVRLIDTHGEDVLRNGKNRYYSPEQKLEMINKVLIGNQTIESVSLEYGLTSHGMLNNWIKSYKGDMNGTARNILLDKVIDEANHKTHYERNFNTERCNEIWSTDVSEFHIAAGKLYLSPILDLHNREIISYNISTSPSYKKTKDMLDKAFNKHNHLKGLVLHSDQGWQYQMNEYHKALKDKGIIQSMSRKGNCLDNSPMESFFGRMKNEMFYGYEHAFNTLEELQKEMEDYIYYYNNQRIAEK